MPTACPLRNWGDNLLPRSSRRPSLVDDWLRASTIWSLPSLPKIRPYMVAGESCSWRATMTAPRRRLVRLRKISVSRRSNLALSEGGLLVQARGNSWGHLIFKDLGLVRLRNRDRKHLCDPAPLNTTHPIGSDTIRLKKDGGFDEHRRERPGREGFLCGPG